MMYSIRRWARAGRQAGRRTHTHTHTHTRTHTHTHTERGTLTLIVHDHVLQDQVAVELVWVVVFVASTAMLVGPLHRDVGSLTIQLSTLPEFLGEEGRGEGKGGKGEGRG